MTRRRFLSACTAAAFAALALAAGPAAAQDKVRIGWALSKTGPNAGGTATTQTPNYQLWVKEVNAAGGLKLGSRRVPIEVVEYDDRSSSEEAVRAIERLITQDKVDFVLPPWGTALNLAVGPTFHKHGYPQLALTAVTDRAADLAKRWPNAFFFLGMGSQYAEGLMAQLETLRKQGRIGNTIAIVSVADGFGIDLSNAARKAVEKHGFKLVYDKTYPLGTQDMAPILSEVKALAPDVFVAFSYPPDTLTLTDQARIAGLNPKVFYTGVGTAFPVYKQRFGANADGVMGIGGVHFDSPAIQDYFKRHQASEGREPDRWASAITYAGLQAFQQAIERVGKVDRAAVIAELKKGSFDTIVGPMKLDTQLYSNLWLVGQWQDGEFHAIAPGDRAGARKAVVPKPAWKN
ncbi:amino acid ABC transporter substrate-binding protein [Schlegelella sp. S2-27]|uniref:Amino acid ABC transporter substrate-binding protein n=1 Tax=Caldimonas mangrovi TaxID=2944811 RepID=A0ABT0YJQ6_9BURK|nr:amino acid ABC transporter substrate-binding protein [Caldimonas mangrovi]